MKFFFSHHKNVTAVALFHHFFSPVRSSVLMFRNCNYMVLFGSARDKTSIRTLASQVKPEKPKFLTSAFEKATKGNNKIETIAERILYFFLSFSDRPYGYLVCDFTVSCPDKYRFRETVTTERPLVYYESEESVERNDEKI